MTTFADIPMEVLYFNMGKLDLQSEIALHGVCKDLKTVTDPSKIATSEWLKEWPTIVETVESSMPFDEFLRNTNINFTRLLELIRRVKDIYQQDGKPYKAILRPLLGTTLWKKNHKTNNPDFKYVTTTLLVIFELFQSICSVFTDPIQTDEKVYVEYWFLVFALEYSFEMSKKYTQLKMHQKFIITMKGRSFHMHSQAIRHKIGGALGKKMVKLGEKIFTSTHKWI